MLSVLMHVPAVAVDVAEVELVAEVVAKDGSEDSAEDVAQRTGDVAVYFEAAEDDAADAEYIAEDIFETEVGAVSEPLSRAVAEGPVETVRQSSDPGLASEWTSARQSLIEECLRASR